MIKYLKVLQHVSDHRGCIIREPLQCLVKNYKNDSIDIIIVVVFNEALYKAP